MKHQHGSGNLQDLERVCMEEWSLISCQVFSKLIRHYKRRLRAGILAKGDCKKYLIKKVPIIVASVFLRKTFIS